MRSRLIICRAPTSPASGGKELATAKRDVVSVESKPNWSKEMSLTSVAAPIWNEIARTQPRNGGARKAFAMDQAEMAALEDREYQALKRRVAPVVASAFLDLKPFADRAASDNEVYVGAPGVSPGASGDSVSQRGGDLRLDGPPIEPDGKGIYGAAATGRPDLARKIALQASAPTDPGASIADALPMLSAGQQEDVAKAERRSRRS